MKGFCYFRAEDPEHEEMAVCPNLRQCFEVGGAYYGRKQSENTLCQASSSWMRPPPYIIKCYFVATVANIAPRPRCTVPPKAGRGPVLLLERMIDCLRG